MHACTNIICHSHILHARFSASHWTFHFEMCSKLISVLQYLAHISNEPWLHNVLLPFLILTQTHGIRHGFAAIRAEMKVAASLFHNIRLRDQNKPIHTPAPKRNQESGQKRLMETPGINRNVSPTLLVIQSIKTHLDTRCYQGIKHRHSKDATL